MFDLIVLLLQAASALLHHRTHFLGRGSQLLCRFADAANSRAQIALHLGQGVEQICSLIFTSADDLSAEITGSNAPCDIQRLIDRGGNTTRQLPGQ
ncbi:hypothetical protein D3C81_1710590 [compost metagenome]